MGGKDGSPGGGVPANELWWRVPLWLIAMSLLPAMIFAVGYFFT